MSDLIDRNSLLEKIQFRIEPQGIVGETVKDMVEKTREIILAEPVACNLSPTEWIPVSERLPKQDQEVIVYDCGVIEPKVYAYHFWDKHFDGWVRITHWMPLPNPPKEVE